MLTEQQQNCISLMIAGKMKQKEIAKEIKVSEVSICTWKKDPEFQQEYKTQLQATFKDLAVEAKETMKTLMRTGSDQVRFNAAKDILDRSGFKPSEDINLNDSRSSTAKEVKDYVDGLWEKNQETKKNTED